MVLTRRLRNAINRLNPRIPAGACEDAFRRVLRPESPALVVNNRRFHQMLRDGVEVEYTRTDGSMAGDRVRLISDDPDENDYLAVKQFTVTEGHHNRCPDIVVFLNGLPVCVFELKSAVDEEATIWAAWYQLQTYKHQIPALFVYNELLVLSDGLSARLGSLTAGKEWFKPWRTVAGEADSPPAALELEVLIRGVFEKERLLRLLRHYIAFEEDTDSDAVHKILAGYHQFHAVENAVAATVAASPIDGDRRGGVVWHTQGSGKSLSMTFFAGRVVTHPAMQNPTLIVLTDRNDLDDQLFGQFARCHELLRQRPVQSESRDQLAGQFRDPNSPFQIVIVRDMWLTGFDAPCLTTMYADKPMRGHGLMQAIARVNRVLRQARRPGGRLPGDRRSAEAGHDHLHRKRWERPDRHRHGGSGRGHAREVRGLSRHAARVRLVQVAFPLPPRLKSFW